MLGILVPAGSIVMFVISVQEYRDAARSSYTQAHGVRRDARVISEHTSTGKYPTSALAVRLSGPVNGHDTTTVHIQGAPTYSPGARVTVVVDPQDPGYAELPGAPYTSDGQWEAPLGIGLGLILFTPCVIGVLYLNRWRTRRRVRRFLLR